MENDTIDTASALVRQASIEKSRLGHVISLGGQTFGLTLMAMKNVLSIIAVEV